MSKKPLKDSDSDKPWNRKKKFENPYLLNKLPVKKAFLIVCEGLNTEPNYLRAIDAPNAIHQKRPALTPWGA